MKGTRLTLALAVIISVVMWLDTPLKFVLLPLTYLNTHIHEFMHAIAAIATGGSISSITVNADGSGQTPIQGGFLLIIGSAGYVGATMLGGALLTLSKSERGSRGALWGLTALLGISMVFCVRGDLVGVLSGVLWVIVLALMAQGMRGSALIFAVQFLGIQQCLTSLEALLQLWRLTSMGEKQSDAGIMEQASGLPAGLWAALWMLISLVVIGIALRNAWVSPPRATKSNPAKPT